MSDQLSVKLSDAKLVCEWVSLVGGVSNVGEVDSLSYVQIWGSGVSTSEEFCVILGEIITIPS